MNKIPQFYTESLPVYQQAAIDADFVFSITQHAKEIIEFVQQVVDAGYVNGYNALRD